MLRIVQMITTFALLRCALSSQICYANNTSDIITIVHNFLNIFKTELYVNSEQCSRVFTKV